MKCVVPSRVTKDIQEFIDWAIGLRTQGVISKAFQRIGFVGKISTGNYGFPMVSYKVWGFAGCNFPNKSNEI